MLRRMRDDVLAALGQVGTYPDENGNVRLYHATDEQAAEAILAELILLPREPEDRAERMLRRGGGSVFLATSPDIVADLGKGGVVLAVDIPVGGTPAEVIRAGWGDPPRVELEVQLPAGENLPLAFVDRLDRAVSFDDLPAPAQEAVAMFAASKVGQQLADHDERAGRCQRASMRFLSALREKGADGTLLAWGGTGWWHCAVLITGSADVVVDWTASQFETEEARADVPYPRIETRAQADARWSPSSVLDIDTALGRSVAVLPELLPWSEAQRAIPDRDSTEAAVDRR
jgi:hypothetical protein